MGFPYTDVNSTYAAEEATGDLLDATGKPLVLKNLIEVNAPVPSVADGMFGKARGPVGEAPSSRPHFSSPVQFDGSQFDVRGKISITVLMWIRLSANTTEIFGWHVWNDTDAEGQAWILSPNVDLPGPVQGPRFHMYNGIGDFVNIGVYARTVGADISLGDWHLIGGSWDADTNTLACFFGDGSDPTGQTYDFNTVAGFADGFGYSANADNAIGKFRHGGVAGADVMEADHLAYWKGRAFDILDFLNHWNSGNGLAFSAYSGRPPMAFSEVQTALKNRSRHWEAEPADLEIDGIDLSDVPDVESRLIDARDNFVYTLWIDMVQNAATVGALSVFCDLYQRDGVTLIESVALVTALAPTTNNQVKVLFGEGVTERLVGTGTIGPELASLKLVHLCKLRVVKDTPTDTSATLSIRMQFGD